MRFPFHEYLGLGNLLNLGKPVDEDDRIALVRDIHYSLSKSNKDIRKADEESILDFYRSFLTTGNWHSLIGGTDLSIKYILESVINVQYPKLMSTSTTRKPGKITHCGHSLYAARQKQLSNLYKQYKHSGESYRQFCQRIKYNTNLDASGAVESTLYVPIAGSSFAHNRHDSAKSSQSEDRAVPNNKYNFDSIFNMDNSEMDVQNDMDNTLSTSQGNRAGTDSSRGTGIIKLYKQPSLNYNVISFTKCYTFYSYGYCVNRFNSPNRATNMTMSSTNYFSTSLYYLPVDQICTYISKAEMDAIRDCNAYAIVTLIGVANSEHVAIACTGIGLNNKIPFNIVSYTTDASAPMKPTGSKGFSADNLVTRLYEDDTPAIMELSEIIQPGSTTYIAHSNGMPLLNKYIDRFRVMSHVGQKVLEYNYKFHYAPLTYAPCVDLCNGLFEIPKLNPALQSTDFQNSSCIYYDVQFNINVALDFNSIYANGPLHATPDNLVAIPIRRSKNTG
ncbi:hypothetical protein FQA39_LY17955 [Lamprigera yunnana]|nr:hypothetical protein FQA39_LY17955 [Lamprigera yunnana]